MQMKTRYCIFCFGFILLLFNGCAPFDKIYSHDFNSGFFSLKSPGKATEKVYLEVNNDTLSVYSAGRKGAAALPDINSLKTATVSTISPGAYLYNSTFVKTSADIDLSTILLKYRPSAGGIPRQLSASVNGVFYVGFRKDFFRITSHVSPANVRKSFVRHTGFDFGPLVGFGITPVNPTTTEFRTTQEYDGIVFQKGFAVFGTYENMSVGISLGFDNLLDRNRSIWAFNNKPWIGLVIGIANF